MTIGVSFSRACSLCGIREAVCDRSMRFEDARDNGRRRGDSEKGRLFQTNASRKRRSVMGKNFSLHLPEKFACFYLRSVLRCLVLLCFPILHAYEIIPYEICI